MNGIYFYAWIFSSLSLFVQVLLAEPPRDGYVFAHAKISVEREADAPEVTFADQWIVFLFMLTLIAVLLFTLCWAAFKVTSLEYHPLVSKYCSLLNTGYMSMFFMVLKCLTVLSKLL